MLKNLMLLAGVSKDDESKINVVIDALLQIPATLNRIESKLDLLLKGENHDNGKQQRVIDSSAGKSD